MDRSDFFGSASIGKVLLKTSIPSIITMLVMLVYNMADMYFIGQTGDLVQVAAVALMAPVLNILSGLGTLIGSGGCSAIATELGKRNKQAVRTYFSFCFYGGLVIGVLFTVVVLLAMPTLLGWLGANSNTMPHARTYLSIVAVGAPFMIFNGSISSIVRAEGFLKESMYGNFIGCALNIILDPLFIFTLDMGVAGAAVATVIGNCVAGLYYVWLLVHNKSSMSFKSKYFSARPKISLRVLSLGLPTATGILLMSIATIFKNNMVASYGDDAMAAMGVAGKVVMVVGMLQMGVTMGMQPVFAYNYGAKNLQRIRALMKTTAFATVVVGSLLSLCIVFFRGPLVAFFINDTSVIGLGKMMASISVISGPVVGLCYLSTTFLQATGKASSATFVSLLRQGLLFLPATILLNALAGLTGLLYASAIADILATMIAVVLMLRHYKSIMKAPMLNKPASEAGM